MTLIPQRMEWEGQPIKLEAIALTMDEYVLLKQGLARLPRNAYRYVLLAQTLLGTGLRLAEVLRLTPQHVQKVGVDTALTIVRGKTHAAKVAELMPISPELGVALTSFIQGNHIGLRDKLFPTLPKAVQMAFRKASEETVGRRIHPKMIRVLYLWHLMEIQGVPIETASKMLGHADIRTTMQYYYKLTPAKKYEINRRIPV